MVSAPVIRSGVAWSAAVWILLIATGCGPERQTMRVDRAEVEAVASVYGKGTPGEASSHLDCEPLTVTGIGRWRCRDSGREGFASVITVHADGSFESRAVGLPATGGCCIAVR